jgi:hypothetical protein
MKVLIAAGAVILTASLAGPTFAAPSHARAQEISSAARTKTKQAKPKQGPRAQARAPRPATFGWRPADPSFDQQGRRYQPPPGLSCPIDLGYGRWASCNDEY